MSGINALVAAMRIAAPSGPGGMVLGAGEVIQTDPLVVDYGGIALEEWELTRPDTLELAGPLQVGDRLLMVSDDLEVFHILHRIFHGKGSKS